MGETAHKIGILGGTFNPIHNGHLAIAGCALDQFDLGTVVFMPTGHTAYKEYAGVDMDVHRCRMVELAIEDEPRFVMSRDEIERDSVSYTYKTLERMRQEYPAAQLFFIIGGDSLRDFHTWKHPERICAQAVILAAEREGVDGDETDDLISEMEARYHGKFLRLNTPRIDISSTQIRRMVSENLDISSMVPASVAGYIEANGLYR